MEKYPEYIRREIDKIVINYVIDVDNKDLVAALKPYSVIKPQMKVRTVYYIIKEFDSTINLDLLLNYIDGDVDIFNVNNYLDSHFRDK